MGLLKGGGGAAGLLPSRQIKIKKTVDAMISNFYVINPSAEIID
jgi:hypothetical protein